MSEGVLELGSMWKEVVRLSVGGRPILRMEELDAAHQPGSTTAEDKED